MQLIKTANYLHLRNFLPEVLESQNLIGESHYFDPSHHLSRSTHNAGERREKIIQSTCAPV